LFHDSHFIDSALFYFGFGPLLFPGSNEVHESTLWLDPDVNLQRADVIHLMCKFPWKTISQGQKTIQAPCTA
jgi:hypothetical protein